MWRDIVLFWDLMGSFASLQGHLPTISTAQVIDVPESFGELYFAPIPAYIFIDDLRSDVIPEPTFKSERIHVDVKMALMWSDDKGPFQLSTVTLGFGPITNKIVYKPVKTIRYGTKTAKL